MTKELDMIVADFRTRPLDSGPYFYLSCDALTMKVREGWTRGYNQRACRYRRQQRRLP